MRDALRARATVDDGAEIQRWATSSESLRRHHSSRVVGILPELWRYVGDSEYTFIDCGRRALRPRYRDPEEPEAASVMPGLLGFVRKFARIVGPSPVENGPLGCKVSSFCQEFLDAELKRPATRPAVAIRSRLQCDRTSNATLDNSRQRWHWKSKMRCNGSLRNHAFPHDGHLRLRSAGSLRPKCFER